MKVLQLRFKNLNSLAGEWQIDLTDPAFAAEGIFALTGPTGAGKSSILDALCLALYGRTPRLGKITKTSNPPLSRQRVGTAVTGASIAQENGPMASCSSRNRKLPTLTVARFWKPGCAMWKTL